MQLFTPLTKNRLTLIFGMPAILSLLFVILVIELYLAASGVLQLFKASFAECWNDAENPIW